MLAYYHYPFVPNQDISEYTQEELMNPEIVEELFDYCQILEAYITKSGWDFLIDYYGYEKLYEIDKKSGWFDEETLEISLTSYTAAKDYSLQLISFASIVVQIGMEGSEF